MILIVDTDQTNARALRTAIDPHATTLSSLEEARRYIETEPDEVDVVVVGPTIDAEPAFRLADSMRIARPALGVVLLRRRVDASLLADALRAGVREVLSDRDMTAVSDAVRRARALARQMREQAGTSDTESTGPLGRLVTVFSAKGGCGKTTVATNLAAALADGGRHEVCLVDLDLAFGDVAIALQLFPAHTIADAVPLGDAPDADAVASLLTPHSPGLTTLVAPVEPAAAETITGALVRGLLQQLRRMFQYIVIDTPPAFTDHVLAAFDESDYVCLIATLDIPALKNLKITLETLDLLNYPRERWKVVLNRADSKVGLSLGEVEKTLRAPIAVQIPSSRDVPASINRGVPIMLDEPRHPVSVAIKQFAENHVGKVDHTSAIPAIPTPLRSDRRSLLRRKAKTT